MNVMPGLYHCRVWLRAERPAGANPFIIAWSHFSAGASADPATPELAVTFADDEEGEDGAEVDDTGGSSPGDIPGSGRCGAETPAISDPRPNFCSVGASSLPLGSMPWPD